MKSLLLVAVMLVLALQANCKVNLKHIKSVENVKDFKKILKTQKNVLTLFSTDDKSAMSLLRWMEDVAKEIKGRGIIVYINCGESKDAKKLCKKFSVNPKPKALKHYKDGKFNKDYDRKDTQKSMLNFMLDPTGDAPWEEDPAAKNVVQIGTEKELNKLRRKEKGPLLIMFYAPWCGYCKKLKPDYAAAATELLGKAVLAGMDVDKPDAFNVRYQFNITGFPTLIYFENGEQKYIYGGKMDKEGLIAWLADPKPVEDSKEDNEVPWSDTAPEILHLNDDTFDNALKENPSIMVMFYAPWCGHCKAMKPEYVDAAKQMTEEEISGTLAAVDCTKSQNVCKKFGVNGYPTIKYFDNAEFKFKLNVRKKDKIIEFMKNPEEPPAPPPEDLPWNEVSGPEILHLTDANFKDELKKKKHVLVMFYAPWCGHCKNAKPEYQKAAEHFKDNRKVWYAGVDCTVEKKSCEQFDVKGFPTFRYFLYGKKDFAYNGGRTSEDFISFMEDPKEKAEEPEEQEPEWKDTPSGVVHLGDEDFDDFLASHDSLLVMFYAPWCGHCKSMKPDYTAAADELMGSEHALAAVDCTKNRKVAGRYEITGYPTIMYFKNGNPTEYHDDRDQAAIVGFMKRKGGDAPKKPLSGWAAESNFVDHLDSDNFDEYIEKNAAVMVMFYAPWCGHCKNMKPAYADAANVFNHEKRFPGAFAAVDCTEHNDICSRYEVRGFPTLIYFKNGKKNANYKGGRESKDLINFMIAGPGKEPEVTEKEWADENKDIEFLTDETFESFVQKETCVLVMFYTGWCGHCKKTKPSFAETARMVNVENEVPGCKLAAVDCVKYKDVCQSNKVTGYPTIKYFKDGEDKINYRGARSAQAFIQFLKNPVGDGEKPQNAWSDEQSDVVHLTALNFDNFLKGKEAFVAFYAPWCGHCNSMKPAFLELATKLKAEESPVVVAAVEATTNRDLAKRELVKAYPTLKYYRNGESVVEFEEHRTLDNMYNFVHKQIEGTDRGDIPIDQAKWEDLPSSVVHLNKDTFQEYLQQKQHVMVTFHIRWCEHCNELRADMMQLASRLSSNGDVFGVAAVNCDELGEFCSEQGVSAFPTIKYYKSGQFVDDYAASMKVDDMANFLQSKHRDEL